VTGVWSASMPAPIEQSSYARSLQAFRSHWIVVALPGEFRRIGDYRTRDIGDISVLVVRDEHGFNVCRNLCTHEDQPLTRRHEAGNVDRIVCPLHAWTFDRAGRFRSPPQPIRVPSDATTNGRDLERFDACVAAGLVWAWAGPDPAPEPPSGELVMLGVPSPPQRLVVDRDWSVVARVLHHLPASEALAPNSAICRATDDRADRLFVTVAPRGHGRSELMTWTDLDAAAADPGAADRGIATFLRRRQFLDDIAAGARSASDGAAPV
jgi:nitrite reductase/ring-hydroxylating ferredoxin subunit